MLSGDGNQLFCVNWSTEAVNQYALSPSSFDPETAVYSGNLSLAPQFYRRPWGLAFSPDGLWALVCNNSSTCKIVELILNEPWDILSAEITGIEYPFGYTSTEDMHINCSASRLYVRRYNTVRIFEFTTAKNLGSIFFVGSFTVPNSTSNGLTGMVVSPDEMIFYFVEEYEKTLKAYTVESPGNLATLTLASNVSVSAAFQPQNVFVTPDGTSFYIMDSGGQTYLYS